MIVIYVLLFCLFVYLNYHKGRALFNYCFFDVAGYRKLKTTILSYGYNYDLWKHFMMILAVCVIVVMAGFLFEIRKESVVCLLLFASLMMPTVMIWLAYHSYQEKVFNDFTMFLQNFIALFKLNPKTYAILCECEKIAEGEMKGILEQMILCLQEGGDIKASMQILVQDKPHFIVYNLTSLVETIEIHGGNQFLDGLDLIQDDIDDWIEDTYSFKRMQISTKNRMLSLCALSLIIAYFAKNMLSEIEFNTQGNLYQIAILIFFAAILVTLVMAHKTISESWIEREECIWARH